MPKQKSLLMFAIFIIIVGLVGALLTYQMSNGEEIDVTEEISNSNITNIKVETDNAKIQILPTDDEFITVELYVNQSRKKYNYDIKEDGTSLTVQLKQKKLQFFSIGFDFSSPKITVLLPEKQYDQLNVETVNGETSVENVNVLELKAKTVNGKINIENTKTKTTKVTAQNGRIHVENVDGEIDGNVVNGHITLVTEDLDRFINLESVNGRVEVKTAKEPTNVTVNVDVVNGRVNFLGDNIRSTTIGDGEYEIKLKTVNGKVTVSK